MALEGALEAWAEGVAQGGCPGTRLTLRRGFGYVCCTAQRANQMRQRRLSTGRLDGTGGTRRHNEYIGVKRAGTVAASMPAMTAAGVAYMLLQAVCAAGRCPQALPGPPRKKRAAGL